MGKRKVAIVGFAPSSRDLAPYGDNSIEIWGCNELYKVAPRIDYLFEIHGRYWLEQKERNLNHLAWLRSTKTPVYMIDHYDDIPSSLRFPIDAIKKEFPRAYFTNTISYQIAYAIYMKYDWIGLYGIDMAVEQEYQVQRPSVEYFVGQAEGRGIEVFIPAESDLLKSMYLYGYQDREITAMSRKMKARKSELKRRADTYKKQQEEMQAAYYQMLGALDDTQYYERQWLYGNESMQIQGGEDMDQVISLDEPPTKEFVDIISMHQSKKGARVTVDEIPDTGAEKQKSEPKRTGKKNATK